MKKRFALIVSVVLTASLFTAGCGNSANSGSDTGNGSQAENTQEIPATDKEETEENNATAETGGLRTGLAMVTDISKSANASADTEGTAQADVTIAAVTVDADGKIVQCVIDSAQTKVGISADGKITTDLASEFQSKQELGEDYGMKKASAIGKEWNEQADAFAAYCEGKTIDEVNGIAVTEEGAAADEELTATCTIHIGGLQAVVAKAVANATELGAQTGDKLGLGVTTNISKSTDASAEGDGSAVPYTTVTAVTVGADGKITSAVIDAVQAKISFDTTGKITADTAAEISSKNELGDAYGMKSASSIGKEWNEQAAAYAQYAVGKTLEEVNGTAVTDEGVPSDADLAASVTVHIADFNTIITKAVSNAK